MRVVVVGGGLGGLFTASELIALGVEDVVVVEAATHPGGVVKTIRRDGFSLEPGAGSFQLPHPHLGPILDRAGAKVVPASGSRSRYLHLDGRLVQLDASPRILLAPVLPPAAKLRALGEVFVGSGYIRREESLASFCHRRFGRRAGELMAWLMAAGVFAGDPGSLSAEAAFPALSTLEREHGSVIRGSLRRRRQVQGQQRPLAHVPAEDMSALVGALASELGDRMVCGFTVDSIRREGASWVIAGADLLQADAVVVALAPEAAARIVDRELAESLGEHISAPTFVVGMGGTGSSPAPEGFGALIGPREGMFTLGLLFESSYAPSRAPNGAWLIKVIAGGATHPELADWDADRLAEAVTQEAGQILGIDPAPEFLEVVRHDPGIPQYNLGHNTRLARLNQLLEQRPNLHLAGWGYQGVGVAALASDAVRIAKAITD